MNIDTRMIVIASIVTVVLVLAYMMIAPDTIPGAKVKAPQSTSAPAAPESSPPNESAAPDTSQPVETAPPANP